MKIAYISQQQPHFEVLTPKDVQYVVIKSTNGHWPEQALQQVADVDAFVVGMEPVDGALLDAAPNVKIVQRLGVGYETLDLSAAATRGVFCCNIEGVNKEAVAEHGMALLLALARELLSIDSLTVQCKWEEARVFTESTMELFGKTMGIFGLGNTGSELAKRAHAMGMSVIYFDIKDIAPEVLEATSARYVSKETLLKTADVISVNTDYNEHSAGLIDAEALSQMKKNTLLICCARGGLVDEAALADALNRDQIKGAGIDVFEPEPITKDNPLLSAKNCIVTSHIAGAAIESTNRTYEWAFENIRRVVERGERPQWIRNGL